MTAPHECPFCRGSLLCGVCGGFGFMLRTDDAEDECGACNGFGQCSRCVFDNDDSDTEENE